MTKSYDIDKKVVWKAYQQVKENRGSFGVDGETIEDFEKDLKNNLYRIWNRMSSGSYLPPPVRLVEIPKSDGGKRPLGIPTVADRVAQMVAKIYLEPTVESFFHEDSYGYRPNKSAHQAITKARKRCWEYGWVLDLDIKGFFNNLNHELLMRAVVKHTNCKWIILYIERWLKAPIQLETGQIQERDKGTPQGGVISPLLANLYLHYAFDRWMQKYNPSIQFERYADDIVCHCRTRFGAEDLLKKLKIRLLFCNLEVHPDKTKVVYCKSYRHQGNHQNISFDFLGYTFQPRPARKDGRGEKFLSFTPAVSCKAMKAINKEIKSWNIQRRVNKTLEDLGNIFNPVIRGWVNYYGMYNRMVLKTVFKKLDDRLARLLMKKYKNFRGHKTKSYHYLNNYAKRNPHVFAHWKFFSCS